MEAACRTVVITGAGGCIGRACAEALAARGDRLALIARGRASLEGAVRGRTGASRFARSGQRVPLTDAGDTGPAVIGQECVIMPRGSTPKRERQYEHIKESALERGESEKRAKEIAARTVNKERARHGESKTASRSSVQDISSSRRGGLRSQSGAQGPTKEQLYNEARQRDIHGRSKMNKKELEHALGR
ncbi:hypothetical protein GCM10018790_15440 [Kitasatospora xanthocidica]|nr:hypothetical protein GCM10018790_15440 [Kitasatospora xanthocidica]